MDITNKLNQTAIRKKRTSYNQYGEPQNMQECDVRARFERKTKVVRFEGGQELKIDAELWTLPTQEIEIDDIIEVSDVEYIVKDVYEGYGLDGVLAYKKSLLKLYEGN